MSALDALLEKVMKMGAGVRGPAASNAWRLESSDVFGTDNAILPACTTNEFWENSSMVFKEHRPSQSDMR